MQHVHGGGIRQTYISLAVAAKGGAGDGGQPVLVNGVGAELVGGHARLFDVHEDIEGTLRLFAAEVLQLVDLLHQIVAAVLELLPHPFNGAVLLQ